MTPYILINENLLFLPGSAWGPVTDALFFWPTDHCFQSYLSEKERKQLPREYR